MVLAGWKIVRYLKDTKIHREVSVRENTRSKSKTKSLDSLQTEYQIIYHFLFRAAIEV